MYKPFSGLITQCRLLIGILNAFLKDVFSCLVAIMSSKNHLFSLSRNASLICVYSSLVERLLRGSIILSFQFVSIYRLFILFGFKAHLPPFKFIWHFLECFQSTFSIVKGPAFCRQHTEIFWLVRAAVDVRLACKLGNVSKNKMTNFVCRKESPTY